MKMVKWALVALVVLASLITMGSFWSENQRLTAYSKGLYLSLIEKQKKSEENRREAEKKLRRTEDKLRTAEERLKETGPSLARLQRIIAGLESIIQAHSKRLNEEKEGAETVVPIIFIPEDQKLEEIDSYVEAFSADLTIIRGWYLQIAGKTFTFSEIKIIPGNYPLEYYYRSGEEKIDWLKVLNELNQKGIIKPWGDSIPLMIVRGLNFAEGWHDENKDWGLAVLGNQTLEAFKGDLRKRYSGMGVIAHELGHALDISHPEKLYSLEGYYSLMGTCFARFPVCGLSERAVGILQQSKFLR